MVSLYFHDFGVDTVLLYFHFWLKYTHKNTTTLSFRDNCGDLTVKYQNENKISLYISYLYSSSFVGSLGSLGAKLWTSLTLDSDVSGLAFESR